MHAMHTVRTIKTRISTYPWSPPDGLLETYRILLLLVGVACMRRTVCARSELFYHYISSSCIRQRTGKLNWYVEDIISPIPLCTMRFLVHIFR